MHYWSRDEYSFLVVTYNLLPLTQLTTEYTLLSWIDERQWCSAMHKIAMIFVTAFAQCFRIMILRGGLHASIKAVNSIIACTIVNNCIQQEIDRKIRLLLHIYQSMQIYCTLALITANINYKCSDKTWCQHKPSWCSVHQKKYSTNR